MDNLTQSQQFIMQVVIAFIPVLLAYLKQRGDMIVLTNRVTQLETENAELQNDNKQLRQELNSLKVEHSDLQARYEANLKEQAGMRGRF